MFNCEKPDVWKKSITLAGTVSPLTKPFPGDERFGLPSQMRRAAGPAFGPFFKLTLPGANA